MAGKPRHWGEGIGATVWRGLAPQTPRRAAPALRHPRPSGRPRASGAGCWKRAPPRSVCPGRRVSGRQAFLLLLSGPATAGDPRSSRLFLGLGKVGGSRAGPVASRERSGPDGHREPSSRSASVSSSVKRVW